MTRMRIDYESNYKKGESVETIELEMAMKTLQLLLVQLLTTFRGAMPAAEITQGPQNVTVNEGESAMFPCLYTGTNEFPLWYINSASYAIQGTSLGLPERHIYFNQTITVRDVQLSDNGNTYRCSFLFGEVTSETAILTVIPAPREACGVPDIILLAPRCKVCFNIPGNRVDFKWVPQEADSCRCGASWLDECRTFNDCHDCRNKTLASCENNTMICFYGDEDTNNTTLCFEQSTLMSTMILSSFKIRSISAVTMDVTANSASFVLNCNQSAGLKYAVVAVGVNAMDIPRGKNVFCGHKVSLTKLQPDTEYMILQTSSYYIQQGQICAIGNFTTLAAQGAPQPTKGTPGSSYDITTNNYFVISFFLVAFCIVA